MNSIAAISREPREVKDFVGAVLFGLINGFKPLVFIDFIKNPKKSMNCQIRMNPCQVKNGEIKKYNNSYRFISMAIKRKLGYFYKNTPNIIYIGYKNADGSIIDCFLTSPLGK